MEFTLVKDSFGWPRCVFEDRGRTRKILLSPEEYEKAKKILEKNDPFEIESFLYRIA